MPDLIKLSRCCVGEEEKLAINRVIDAGQLGMGQEVMFFEKELEVFFSNKVHVACVNTGTSALQLAVQACGIGYGDEVIAPSITYVASFQAISATGAKPIACDIDPKTGCLDVQNARKKINTKTKAIMYVHYASNVGDRNSIFRLAKECGLRVIEDAAHSFGGYHNGQRIGEIGDVICFSFDGIKNITCGEGGAVVSSDQQLIDHIRDLRLLGVKKDTDQRYVGKRSWDFDVDDQGWRYHMSNINAAIGREQLKKIDEFGKKRRYFAELYMELMRGFPVKFLNLDLDNIIPHIFPIFVDSEKRDVLRDFLLTNNIETGVHYKPNHLLTKFKEHNCQNAEDFGKSVLSLPLHVWLEEKNIIQITCKIREFLNSHENRVISKSLV